MDAHQAAARIREALEAGPTPGPWLYRGKSNSFHKPPPEGTQYVYGDFILTVGSDYDDEKPETQANIDYIAACSPDSLRALLAERDELAKDAANALAALDSFIAQPDKHFESGTADFSGVHLARAALTKKD